MQISDWLLRKKEYLVNVRRWLHRNPEIGFKEFETSKYLKSILENVGYTIIQNKFMKTGFYCEYGYDDSNVLGIRCDMDGLLIDEVSKKEYKSINPGVMHACGHDIHMTIVIGIALFLKERNKNIPGKIRFIFQPAEEQAPGGSISMIEGGALLNMNHIIAGHVLPKLSADKIGIKYGPMAAIVEIVEIIIKGPGGHTSRPNESVDLAMVMSMLIVSLQESVNDDIDKNEPAVLAFGKINGGHAFNVLPDMITLKGTLRYLNPQIKDLLYKKFKDIILDIQNTTGAKISLNVPYTSPGVINDEYTTKVMIDAAKQSIGSENLVIMEESSMGGEDFAYYLEHIPGSYFRIGCSDGIANDVHTPNFDVNEDCILTAVEFLEKTINIYFESK